jgi:hypothetical protein
MVDSYEKWLTDVKDSLESADMALDNWQNIWPFDFQQNFRAGMKADVAAIKASHFWWQEQATRKNIFPAAYGAIPNWRTFKWHHSRGTFLTGVLHKRLGNNCFRRWERCSRQTQRFAERRLVKESSSEPRSGASP